jgi:hypothetical protein
MPLVFALAFAALASASAQDTVDISTFLEFGNPWEQSASVFMRSVNQPGKPRSFDWVDQDSRDQARFPKWRNSPPVTLWKLKVWEGLADFDDGRLTRLKISLYNKGDVEAANGTKALIKGDGVNNALLTFQEATAKWTGTKGKEERDRSLGASGITIRKRYYVKDDRHLVTLVWSYSGRSKSEMVLEYATLFFEPLSRDNDPRIARASTSTSKEVLAREKARPTEESLKANVKRTAPGDVFIDGVPMVDQGQKGYCAVATTERVIKYYGGAADQHVIAQLADSSGRAGTSIEALATALEKAGPKLGVRVKMLSGMEADGKEWRKLADGYNRQARRQKAPVIKDEVWIVRHPNGGGYYDLKKLMDAMEWDVYREYKIKREKTEYTRFKLDVKRYVDSGLPLAWSVMLGRVEESVIPQQGGGHMRMIIGYNEKNDEIIYTDSWGAGHEFKKMKMDDAWSITMMLHLIAPRLQK